MKGQGVSRRKVLIERKMANTQADKRKRCTQPQRGLGGGDRREG